LICCGSLKDIKTGYEFGNLAIKLLEKRQIKFLEAKVILSINIGIKHWKEPIGTSLISLKENHQTALEIGDLEYAGYSASVYTSHALFGHTSLILAEQQMAQFSQTLQNFKQDRNVKYINLSRQLALNLMGQDENPNIGLLIGQVYDEVKQLPIELASSDRNNLLHIYTYRSPREC
jgi:predicted ATPase